VATHAGSQFLAKAKGIIEAAGFAYGTESSPNCTTTEPHAREAQSRTGDPLTTFGCPIPASTFPLACPRRIIHPFTHPTSMPPGTELTSRYERYTSFM
jgi:hypothetical protein